MTTISMVLVSGGVHATPAAPGRAERTRSPFGTLVGGRGLVRSADALLRLGSAPSDLQLAVAGEHPLERSVAGRLGARVVRGAGGSLESAIDAAVASAAGDWVAIVPAGFFVTPDFIDVAAHVTDAMSPAAAFAPLVRLRTPDGLDGLVWQPNGTTLAEIVADPAASPVVLFARAAAWRESGGLDPSLGPLSHCDLWLRLASGPGVAVLPHAIVERELRAPERTPAADPAVIAALRALLERHRPRIEASMADVLVAQERRFVRLREAHSELVRRRDEDLAELDRVRAGTAHHRAFLVHHGEDRFEWGDLRRTDPVSRDWGYDRGGPVDRRHIEAFIAAHSSDIKGRVLEVQEGDLSARFGGPRVAELTVLDIDAANPHATVVADLRSAPEITDEHFDCLVLTQTLHVIDDMAAALGEAHRILEPGGVLLATFPSASRVCLEYGPDGDFWRLTPAGARALVGGVFGHGEVSIDVRGNALTNVAFLEGLGAGELSPEEYDVVDPYYPALTGVRARKATGRKRPRGRGVVLLYHRVADGADAHGLSVPPAVFEAHLAWLSRACDIVPLDVLLSSEAGTLPARAVSLTFDDGYVDNLEVAAPLLARAGTPATFFLTTAHLDSRGEYWWDTLERILLGGREVPPRLRLAIDGSSREFPTGSTEDRAVAHWEIHRGLVRAGLDARRQAIDGLRTWAGDARTGAGPMVADEVRSLAGMPGVTVGAHGVHHLALPSQPPDVRAREIDGSRAALARLTGRPVDLFAYPYGDTSWDAAGDVRLRGLWGVTCVAARLEESFDAAQAPRLDVKPWSVEDLAARVERLLDTPAVGPGAVSLGP